MTAPTAADPVPDLVRDARQRLVRTQGESGGWGFRPGQPATTECTALAVMALREGPAADRGLDWLRARQRPDGAWPMSDQVPDPSWMSSLAVLALDAPRDVAALSSTGPAHARNAAPADPAAVRGAEWLLGQRSGRLPWLMRAWFRLFPSSAATDQDMELVGWPWAPGTTAWVEPTAWALLAVRRLRSRLPEDAVAFRIGQAELMLADRMCVGGGWNYGNRIVMGSEIPPYPDTTALALMALRDAADPGRNAALIEPGFERLREMLLETRSILVLALATMALRLHGRDAADTAAGLADRLAAALAGRLAGATEPDARSIALAVMALDSRPLPFADGRHA